MDEKKVAGLNPVERHIETVNEFFNEAIPNSDEPNKVRFNILNSPSLYLPTINKVSKLLGFTFNHNTIFSALESQYSKPLDVSRGSRYELSKKGVSQKTARKLINWLKSIPFPWEAFLNESFIQELERYLQVNSNAGDWLGIINGYHLQIEQNEQSEEGLELLLFLQFTKRRCDAEVEFLLRVNKETEEEKLSKGDSSKAIKVVESFWRENSRLSKCRVDRLAFASSLSEEGERLTSLQMLEAMEDYAFIYFDFYLEAITHYDIGVRIIHCQDQRKLINDLGFLTKSILTYAQNSHIKTCFDGVLECFKSSLFEFVGETSYRKLSSFIELNDAEPSEYGESEADKKYKQFKDWRNGLNLPSNEKLRSFLASLDEYAQTNSGVLSFEMCRIALGLDKLRVELLREGGKSKLAPVDVEAVIKKVLSHIPDYYRKNLKRELKNREPKI